jgi:Pyruvate/2-oxoacid:ferredoxin oxidoreductase gamma subunit
MEGIPVAPAIPMPGAYKIPSPVLPPPTVDMPKWVLVPVKPEDIKPLNPKVGEGKNEEATEEENKAGKLKPQDSAMPKPGEIKYVEIPFTDIEIPVPREEIVVTAVTTAGTAAVVSVGATLAATSLFKEVMKLAKPLTKAIVKKLAKIRKKPAPLTWARQRLKESRLRKLGRMENQGGS